MKNIILLVLVAMLTGCEKNVQIDLPKELPKLVVNSFFTPDSAVSVQVSLSQPVLERPFLTGIEDASVKLFEEGQEIATLKLDTSLKFVYTTNNKNLIKAGSKYSLTVATSKYGTATAQSFVPLPVKINKVTITESAGVSVDGAPYNLLKLELSDPANAENFYAVKVKSVHYKLIRNNQANREDTLWSESLQDLFLEPSISSLNPNTQLLFSDKSFNGRTTSLLLYYFPAVPPAFRRKGISIALITTGKDYYEYNKRLRTHLTNQTFELLGGETIPMPNNIKNGYGIFAGYSEDQVFQRL